MLPKPVFNLYAALFWTSVDEMVEPKAAEPAPPTTRRMLIASFNTRSLVDEGSIMSVAQQLWDGGVDMCGVQEGRSREQRLIETDGFFIWASAADAGNHGTELWLRKTVFAKKDVHILVSEPRVIMARVRASGRAFLAVATHAP